MSIFKPTRNADFLRSRNLFFVVILVLHLIWSIVAALDVSSQDTRRSSSHVAVAAYNLAIQVVSFGTISFVYYVDSKQGVNKSKWFSHIFFEIILLSVLSVLQIAGALAYSALSPRFACGTTVGSACSTAIHAILVGSWTISLLYLIFMLWFTASVMLAAKRDSTVWRSRARSFDWEAEGHPSLIIPSSPINILGAEKSGSDSLPKPRKTWVLPLRQGPRPRLESTPHLPIQNLPPPTPFYPMPPVPPIPEDLTVNRQSIPEDISLTDTRDDDLRPISMPQSVTQKQRNKIMSIKPLRLQRARGSLDKSSIGLPKAITVGHETLTDSKIMSLTAVESQFQHWWDPQSSFAPRRSTERRSSDRPSFLAAPTISSRSRYSTSTTIPPTPPPKDNWRLPQSATTANTPMHEYPDRRLMTSPPPRGFI